MSASLSPENYRRMRRIMLRVARSYRAATWGPADPAAVKAERLRMASLRTVYYGGAL